MIVQIKNRESKANISGMSRKIRLYSLHPHPALDSKVDSKRLRYENAQPTSTSKLLIHTTEV